MPTPKKTATKKAATPVASASPQSPQMDERAKAIAELVRGGMSYSEAKDAIDNDRPAATQGKASEPVNLGRDPGADEEIDPDSIPDPKEDLEIVDIDNVPPKGFKMIEYLYELRDRIKNARTKRRYAVNVVMDQRIFEWLLYATIAEAQFRGRAELSVEDFLNIKIKELKATDPTDGGRRNASSSGLKDSYNPATGRWS